MTETLFDAGFYKTLYGISLECIHSLCCVLFCRCLLRAFAMLDWSHFTSLNQISSILHWCNNKYPLIVPIIYHHHLSSNSRLLGLSQSELCGPLMQYAVWHRSPVAYPALDSFSVPQDFCGILRLTLLGFQPLGAVDYFSVQARPRSKDRLDHWTWTNPRGPVVKIIHAIIDWVCLGFPK